MRQTRLGPERIGSVLAGQTRAWVGNRLGVGFYRAGGYAVGFVFRPDRGQLDDRVTLPKLRGRIADAHATIGDDRAWLWLVSGDGAVTCTVIGADARVIATETLADQPWVAGIGGACAAGAHLFVPTDDGIARIEVVQGAIVQTRVFAETAPLVGAGDRLVLHQGGIDVVRRRDAIRLQLT
jgi:H/ACA ribonucleoprotein complex subunit 3